MSESASCNGIIDAILATRGASLVVIAPHPDDESIAAGGLVQIALELGARVTVVLLTDGDNNPWPQRAVERRALIGPRERERWGRRRRGEVQSALAILGVPDASVQYLGLPDLGLTSLLTTGADAAAGTLCDVFREVRPTLIVSPSLSDRHPDHSAAHVMCRLALAACGSRAQLLSYAVHGIRDGISYGSSSEYALDQRTRERKIRAVAAYHTQLALSRDRIMAYAARPERFVFESTQLNEMLSQCARLPWRLDRLSAALAEVLLVAGNRSWRVAIESDSSATHDDERPRCFRGAGGQVQLRIPKRLCVPAPAFAKLAGRLRSPWIYDRWGWTPLISQ